tara:strand:+ start:1411 stop:1647 length:237 start_codon:yes stop_codon:yes gene_type:complete
MDLHGISTRVVMAAPHRPVGAWILLIGNRELIRFIRADPQSALLAGVHHGIADEPIPEQLITHAWIHGSGPSPVNGRS